MSRKYFLLAVAGLFAISAVLRLAANAILPPTQDEAYYWTWSQHLAAGYYDHPPLVAWLGWLGGQLGDGIFYFRVFNLVLALLTFFVWYRLLSFLGLAANRRAFFLSLVILQCNFMALAFGVLSVPDTGLLFAWSWALLEALRALKQQPWRWLLVGVACGIGLLAKFLMLLAGPIFVWMLWKFDRPTLRTRWPYLGFLLTVVVYAPNVVWNAQNDWVTFRFQLKHGFQAEHLADERTSNQLTLPHLERSPPKGSREQIMGDFFIDPREPERPPRVLSWSAKLQKRLNKYVGGELFFWGLLLIPMAVSALILWRQRKSSQRWFSVIDDRYAEVLFAATLFPLGLFGFIALFSDVEANWAAMYLVGAAPLMGMLADRHKLAQWYLATAAANLCMVTLLVVHSYAPFLPIKAKQDRLLQETGGFKELGTFFLGLEDNSSVPIFTERYQEASLLSFYLQDQTRVMSQWPGITRGSEWTRNTNLQHPAVRLLIEEHTFLLILNNRMPPKVSGYHLLQYQQVNACLPGPSLHVVSYAENAPPFANPCPAQLLRRWYIGKYVAVK